MVAVGESSVEERLRFELDGGSFVGVLGMSCGWDVGGEEEGGAGIDVPEGRDSERESGRPES